MKTVRTYQILYVFMMLMIFLLIGCGNGKDNIQSGNDEEILYNNKDKENTISWTNYIITPVPKNAEGILKYESMFNVDIDFWNLEHSRFEELLNIQLAEGQIPDFFMMRKPSSLPNYVEQGVLAEIPIELLKKHAPNLYNVLEEEAPGYLEYGKVNGKLYGIPAVNPTNIFHIPIVYRKDWMDNVGVKNTPDTLDEFETLMYKFAKEDPDRNGKDDTYGLSLDGMNAVFGAFGGVPLHDYWVEQDGQIINSVTMPDMKKALALLRKWYKDGVLDPEFITGENQGGYWAISHAFVNGRIGMTNKGNFYHWIEEDSYVQLDKKGNIIPLEPSSIMKQFRIAQKSGEIVFGQPPIGPDGKRGTRQYNMLMRFYGIGINAIKEEGKMAKILEIVDYSSAPPDYETRLERLYGTRGEHWDWINKEEYTYEILPPYKEEGGNNISRGYQALSITLPIKSVNPRDKWAYTLGLDKYGIESAIQIATPSMTKYAVKLQKLRKQAYISIITGEKSLEYFDKFVEEYNEAGGQKIEKEVKEWYASQQED